MVGAIDFSGENDYVEIGHDALKLFNSDFTISISVGPGDDINKALDDLRKHKNNQDNLKG